MNNFICGGGFVVDNMPLYMLVVLLQKQTCIIFPIHVKNVLTVTQKQTLQQAFCCYKLASEVRAKLQRVQKFKITNYVEEPSRNCPCAIKSNTNGIVVDAHH